ncbi:MAG: Gfo/Idh/MocA family oxidoreductase [Verrucomicrobiota bacterium]
MKRRDFIQAGAAGLALTSSTGLAQPENGQKKRVGLIGCGWYGKCDLWRLLQVADVEIVSLCDPDSKMLEECAKMSAEKQKSGNTPKTYGDYREMLKEKNLDIVLIETPDHWHALPMIDAVKAGADVYVQKPISVDITEAKAMLAAAKKYNKVVQVGMQRRSTPHLIEAREEIVKAGKLGKIAHVEICCYYHMSTRDNPADTDPPEHLDYEMWTGPAPMRPYNELVHPRRWRAFNEYSNGIVGDMCVHMLDAVRWIMDLGMPKSVSSTGGILVDKTSKATTTDTQNAVFDYGDLQVVWQHRAWGHAPDPEYPWALFLYGDKGTLKASVNKYEFIPRGKGQEGIKKNCVMELEEYPEDKTEKDLEKHVAPAIRGHMVDFLANIESRGKPVSNIEEGYISTVACILANISLELGGRELTWDNDKGEVVGDEEANKLLTRPYRGPWKHPQPDTV